MFCKKCGSKIAEDSIFCSSCGSKIEDEISEISVDNSEETSDGAESIIDEEAKTDTNRFEEWYRKKSDKLFLGGFSLAAFGVVLFLGIVLVSLIGWGEVYLFGGYDFTAILAAISLISMFLGLLVLLPVLIANIKLKSVEKLAKKTFLVLSIVLLVCCLCFVSWGVADYAIEQDSGSSSGGSSYDSGYNDYYSSGIDKSIGLSLKVDNITKSGNYTYVYCSVKNVSAKYVATQYRYVKVKAQFKNSSGSIVDTDWTYAVDSAWLEPGETKTFYFMVKDTNIKSATLSFMD